MTVIENTINGLMSSSPAQSEFYQAVEEVLESLEPLLEKERRYTEHRKTNFVPGALGRRRWLRAGKQGVSH